MEGGGVSDFERCRRWPMTSKSLEGRRSGDGLYSTLDRLLACSCSGAAHSCFCAALCIAFLECVMYYFILNFAVFSWISRLHLFEVIVSLIHRDLRLR